MPGWFRRKPTLPPLSSENPGQGPWMRTAFANGERGWEEEVHATRILAGLLEREKVQLQRRGDDALVLDNGLILRPQIVACQPRDDGAVRTTTTIEINHPALFPNGIFEYQHAIGETMEASLQRGFQNWREVDLPVFEDALRGDDRQLMYMTLDPPAGKPVKRQIILGPPAHLATGRFEQSSEEHCFCPCCLFTNCFEAFREQLNADAFYGIRLLASRSDQGEATADCRINGIDWPAGQEALIKYAATWPERGWEMRKQFVAIRTVPS